MPETAALLTQAVNERLRLLSIVAAIGGFVVLVLIAIFMSVVLILALRVQDAATTVELQAQQSHDALCAQQDILVADIRQATTFLAKQPEGLVVGDTVILSPAEIEADITRQREYLDAIRDNVFCGEGS